jgi:hypothetical protein
MDKLFVSIASYEDLCLVPTIEEALKNAKYPDRIVFGLGLQFKNPPNLDFLKNKKVIYFKTGDDRPGIVRVRHEISKLISDEKYFLQIDSHSHFMPSWDEELIDLLNHAFLVNNSKDAVLSGVPSDIVGKDIHLGDNEPRTRIFGKFKDDLSEQDHFINRLDATTDLFDINYKNDFYQIYRISAGYLFSETRLIKEIGLDPYSRQLKEEAYFSWKILISGWNIYQPRWCFPIGHDPAWQIKLNGTLFIEDNAISRFNGKNYHDWISTASEHMMSLAMIFNDYSYYAIKNAKRSAEEVWEMAGMKNVFDIYKKKYLARMKNEYE